MSVPVFSDLLFYSEPSMQEQRYQDLVTQFKAQFQGIEPDFITRSPGRVNLMGDHIDYAYFPVFPMAIESDVIAAVAVDADEEVVITNTDTQFTKESFKLPENGQLVEIDIEKFSWANYFKCGLIVAQKYIEETHSKQTLKGLKVLFNGTVPTGGGLSSLAAFCVASTLLVLRANGVTDISKKDLTRITVVSEHLIGLNNGGMDQTALIYGEKGKALLVTFQPKLEGIPFSLPNYDGQLVFLITNSLIKANKKETAPFNYNLRAVEAAVVAEVLAAKFGFKLPQDSNLKTGQLRGFMEEYYVSKGQAKWENQADIGIERTTKMLEVLEDVFDTEEKKSGYTTEEAAAAIGISLDEFHKRFLTAFPVSYKKLKLYQRSKHIYSEAKRVLELIQMLQDPVRNPTIEEIGDLFNSSHESLRNLYETVPPQMDLLVEVAQKNGVAGSRVTGAGFGGSVVHILKADKLDGLVEAIKKDYYEKVGILAQDAEEAFTVTRAGQGSCVVLKKFNE